MITTTARRGFIWLLGSVRFALARRALHREAHELLANHSGADIHVHLQVQGHPAHRVLSFRITKTGEIIPSVPEILRKAADELEDPHDTTL